MIAIEQAWNHWYIDILEKGIYLIETTKSSQLSKLYLCVKINPVLYGNQLESSILEF